MHIDDAIRNLKSLKDEGVVQVFVDWLTDKDLYEYITECGDYAPVFDDGVAIGLQHGDTPKLTIVHVRDIIENVEGTDIDMSFSYSDFVEAGLRESRYYK